MFFYFGKIGGTPLAKSKTQRMSPNFVHCMYLIFEQILLRWKFWGITLRRISQFLSIWGCLFINIFWNPNRHLKNKHFIEREIFLKCFSKMKQKGVSP